MALITIRPTGFDRSIAKAIAAHTSPETERVAEILTWGADEHVLCALAIGWWFYSRNKGEGYRRTSDHLLLTTLAASALPHLLKTVIDQRRPDRETVSGHCRGIPFSGKENDAFPSGHALHVGALASAATVLPSEQRNIVWGIGGTLVLTRILLLAHWVSDVVVGLAAGAVLERSLRPFTGFKRRKRPPD
jgi:undecaprenyl-diphosphatase